MYVAAKAVALTVHSTHLHSVTHSLPPTLTLTPTHSHTHTLTLKLTHSLTPYMHKHLTLSLAHMRAHRNESSDNAMAKISQRLTKESDQFLGEKVIEVQSLGETTDLRHKLGQ